MPVERRQRVVRTQVPGEGVRREPVHQGKQRDGFVAPGVGSRSTGWTNVDVRLGDACRPAFDQPDLAGREFDAAIATFAISAMPDAGAVLRNVRDALRPGGQLFVIDLCLVPRGRTAALGIVLVLAGSERGPHVYRNGWRLSSPTESFDLGERRRRRAPSN